MSYESNGKSPLYALIMLLSFLSAGLISLSIWGYDTSLPNWANENAGPALGFISAGLTGLFPAWYILMKIIDRFLGWRHSELRNENVNTTVVRTIRVQPGVRKRYIVIATVVSFFVGGNLYPQFFKEILPFKVKIERNK